MRSVLQEMKRERTRSELGSCDRGFAALADTHDINFHKTNDLHSIMKNSDFFRPAGRAGFFKIELTLCAEVVRALKWLHGHEQAYHGRRNIKQLCENVLCDYSAAAYIGKPHASYRRDALKRRRPVYAPVTDEQLLIEEIADAIEWGRDPRKRYRRMNISVARAAELVQQRRTGRAIRWTKALNKS